MYLFYIRHGNPCYDPDCLTPYGKREAEAIGRRLATFGVDEIYSSTLIRAMETSAPLSEILQKNVIPIGWANERNTAKWFYLNDETYGKGWVFALPKFKDIFSSKEVFELGFNWYNHPKLKKYNFVEGVKELDKYIDDYLLSLGYKHDREHRRFIPVKPTNKRIALFAHQGMGIYFLSSILDIPYPQFCIHFDIITTGLTTILFEVENGYVYPKIVQFSGDGHLLKENLPTKYGDFRY